MVGNANLFLNAVGCGCGDVVGYDRGWLCSIVVDYCLFRVIMVGNGRSRSIVVDYNNL